MSNDWSEVKLGDVLVLQRGFDLPEKDRRFGAYPVVASTGTVGMHDKAMAQGPGVVIGRSGSLGGGQFIESDFWPLNISLWVKDFKENHRRFCYYLLKSLNFSQFNVGSGVPTLNRNHILPSLVRLPPIREQRAIAHILGTLDDKIELNRRMNETLEGMARAMFKAWFVDFEPVRAKMEGRWRRGESLAGLPAELYDAFPERLVDSELGEIPEGWRIGSFGEVASHPKRSVPSERMSPTTPYIALEHMPKRCISLVEWGFAEGVQSNKHEFKKREILFGKLRPYFHKVGIAPFDGVCSTDIVVIKPLSEVWLGLVFCCAFSDEFVEHTNAGSTGTKMPRTSWSEMARYRIALPSEEIAEVFNRLICSFVDKIISAVHESRTLVSIRDVLLPKLISGELRMKDAEDLVGRAL